MRRLLLALPLAAASCATPSPPPAAPTVDIAPAPTTVAPEAEPDAPADVAEIALPESTELLEEPTLVLSITASGDLVLGGSVLADLTALEDQARAIAARDPDTTVVIMADERVIYSRLIEAMDALRQGGLTQYQFVVQASSPAP